jgi:DNA-binding FadR family transcriptional regulator
VFDPLLTAPTTVERCADALRRSILDGRLPPGSRLPPERRLAESFGVNRVTVRSALTRLTAAGLVQARRGSGYTVRDFRTHGGPGLIPGIIETASTHDELTAVVRDLLLVRRHLAGAVLERLVSEGTTDAGLDAFDRAVDAFETVLRADPTDASALGDADMKIVASLVAATGSSVLALCLNPISAVVRDLPDLRRALYAEPESNLMGWRALGALLRSADLARDSATILVAVSQMLEARDRDTLARLESP